MRRKIKAILLAILFCSILFRTHRSLVAGDQAVVGSIVFENVTQQVGLARWTSTFGAATYDANGDGWPDLLISNHGLPPSLYVNHHGAQFVRVENRFLKLTSSDRHAPELGDFDNDGDQDLYFQHGAHSGTGLGPKEFYLNQGNGKPFLRIHDAVLEDPKGRGRTAVWFDYDSDGLLDLFAGYDFREDAPDRLYHNLGNGRFEDATKDSGLNISVNAKSGGALAVDIDNDGDMDLFLCGQQRPYLFTNDGKGHFKDETAARGIPFLANIWGATVADYNNDGFPDLYLARGDDVILEGALMGEHRINFLHSVTAKKDRIDTLTFHADSRAVLNFKFYISVFTKMVDLENIYVGAEGENPGVKEFKVGPGFLAPEGKPPQWRADGGQKGTFIWRDSTSGVWTIAAASGNSSFFLSGGLITTASNLAGLDRKGMERPWIPEYPNVMLQNTGGTFVDVTGQTQTGDPSNSRTAVWEDLDNDGDLELYVVNAGFNGSSRTPDSIYYNDEAVMKKLSVPLEPGEIFGRGDGAVSADFNNDGLLDLFILNGSGALPNNYGPYEMLYNRTNNGNHWISLTLVGGGRGYTNRDAIGARIKAQTSGKIFWQLVPANNGATGSQSTRTVHFGLGSSEEANVTVLWPPSKAFPSGHEEVLHFGTEQVDHHYIIRERN